MGRTEEPHIADQQGPDRLGIPNEDIIEWQPQAIGLPVLVKDVAQVVDSLENAKVGGWYGNIPAVVINVHRQPGANVIETVQRIKAELPRLQRAIPSDAKLTLVNDRTGTIRASVRDVQFTLVLSVALVVLVVLLFLRTIRATIIAGVALPVSLIATFGVMWFCGFGLDVYPLGLRGLKGLVSGKKSKRRR